MTPANNDWLAFWTLCARAWLAAGIKGRGERGGFLTDTELVELDAAITEGVTPDAFAERIIDRAAAEEANRQREEWIEDFNHAAD